MTMARVKDGEVVAVGLPNSLQKESKEKLYKQGWRKVKGTPKPEHNVEGMAYVYGHPYSYDAEEDTVYGTWIEKDIAAEALKNKREKASLSRADFKLALLEQDELDNVKAAMSDPSADTRAVILWEDALEFKRMNKDLLTFADEMGYTDEQLDEIFSIDR